MSDESLRASYQSHVASNPPANRAGCPTADELDVLAGARQVGDNPVLVARLEHVLSCASCRPEFELLRATHVAAAGETRTPHSAFTPQRMGLAALLLLAVGIGGETWRRNQLAQTRGAIVDASEFALVAPVSAIAAPFSAKFVWRAVSGAVAYQLEVLDSTGTPAVQLTTADTTAQLSPADSARVAALSVFDWMVTARRSDGNERRSALTRVRSATAERR